MAGEITRTIVHYDDSPESVVRRRWENPEEFLCLSVRSQTSEHFKSLSDVLDWLLRFRELEQSSGSLASLPYSHDEGTRLAIVFAPAMPDDGLANIELGDELANAGAIVVERDSKCDAPKFEESFCMRLMSTVKQHTQQIRTQSGLDPFREENVDTGVPLAGGEVFANPPARRLTDADIRKMFETGQNQFWTDLDY